MKIFEKFREWKQFHHFHLNHIMILFDDKLCIILGYETNNYRYMARFDLTEIYLDLALRASVMTPHLIISNLIIRFRQRLNLSPDVWLLRRGF